MKIRRGEMLANLSFGYVLDDRKPVIDEPKAEIVREIFALKNPSRPQEFQLNHGKAYVSGGQLTPVSITRAVKIRFSTSVQGFGAVNSINKAK